jgi:glycosyltransferase involved in cell wall biosynthesis
MTIVINGRFQTRPITGVERYAYEIARRIRGDVRVETPSAVWRGGRGHLWEQFLLPARVRTGETLFSPANTGPLRVRKQIVTIHDLSPLEHPEWFSASFAIWYRLLWPALARRVKGILTDSNFSRQRIIARLGINPEKVIAIQTGVDPVAFHPASQAEILHVRQRYRLEKDFLLFVGSLQPRKNLSRLLGAWEQIQPEYPLVELVIAGTGGPQFQASLLNHSAARCVGYVPDTDLPGLYSAALGLVHPGLYEGSGLTLLEAMACGCPVAAANTTALPEVVGEAGLLFDPYDVAQIAKGLRHLLEDDTLRNQLQMAGLDRVNQFTWDRACDDFHESLHTLQVW